MRGGDQLLGIGADAVFEARAEGVLRFFEHAAVGRDRAPAALQIACPDRRCRSLIRDLQSGVWSIIAGRAGGYDGGTSKPLGAAAGDLSVFRRNRKGLRRLPRRALLHRLRAAPRLGVRRSPAPGRPDRLACAGRGRRIVDRAEGLGGRGRGATVLLVGEPRRSWAAAGGRVSSRSCSRPPRPSTSRSSPSTR